MTPVIRIRIDFAENVHVGPGKIALLEAIKSSGSISDAARSLGMSYRRAWMLINSLKQGFSEAVTVSSTGGAGGGGARVTNFGASLIKQYRMLEREIGRLGAQRLTDIVPHVMAKTTRSEHGGRKQLAKKIVQRAEKISENTTGDRAVVYRLIQRAAVSGTLALYLLEYSRRVIAKNFRSRRSTLRTCRTRSHRHSEFFGTSSRSLTSG
jgi:molybdate transport system regulatory protein